LEHVSLPIAQQYFEKIKINYPEKWKDTVLLNLTNDSYGNPRRYKFQDVGWISPTTLRYISTCLEIDRLINLSNCQDVVEIGVGYGGQAAVISRMFNIQRYSMFDLPIALQLTSIYLEKIDARVPIAFPGNRSLSEEKYDLVISNFAFSELPKDLQIKYLDEVICNSKNGYMIMNSGLSNKTGRSIGKLSLEEIMVYLPHAQIIDEIPLTGPDNYVIYWRDYAEAISSASIMR
jgi:putative sugar O-methyltransferase